MKSRAVAGPLDHIRVLDLSDEKGAYCTKLLADLGARVTKVEPPEGDGMRRKPPYANDTPDPDGSLYFAYYHANKRSISLNLRARYGGRLLRKLVRASDVVVSSFSPAVGDALRVHFAPLRRANPGLVFCSITPFGLTGPYRNFRATHVTLHAMGGQMYTHGEAGGPPVTMPGIQMYDLAGSHAALSIMVALRNRSAVGGQAIDISIQEVMATQSHVIQRYALAAVVPPREGHTPPNPPAGTWRCRDGYVELQVWNASHWAGFLALMGHPQELSDPNWEQAMYRNQHREEVTRLVTEFTSTQDKQQLAERAQALHVPAAAVNTLADFVKDPQPISRGFFVEVDHPPVGRATVPGAPYRLSRPLWSLRTPAPPLGQHNHEVYCQELGFPPQQIEQWQRAGLM